MSLGDLTVGLYSALAGTRAQHSAGEGDQEMEDVLRFDENSASVLNEKMQKEKRRVEYVFTDEGGSSHRKHFAVELRVDGQLVGRGEGVSKKVAKAKAADAALRSLDVTEGQRGAGDSEGKKDKEDARPQATGDSAADTESSEADALAARRPLCVLGVDIDGVLITRAKKKTAALASGDTVEFLHVDVMTTDFNKQVGAFLEQAKRPPTAPRKFDLVTCFSVTMWIHLNHGDDGLWRFLGTVSDMTEHLLVEPQPWKCYRWVPLRGARRLGLVVSSPLTLRVMVNLSMVQQCAQAPGAARRRGPQVLPRAQGARRRGGQDGRVLAGRRPLPLQGRPGQDQLVAARRALQPPRDPGHRVHRALASPVELVQRTVTVTVRAAEASSLVRLHYI